MKWFCILACAGLLLGQDQKPGAAEQEQADLNRAVGESGASPVDLIHALEKYLRKYPNSPQRPGIEKALAKSAMDTNDRKRIVLYGEKVLSAEPDTTDLGLIDRVVRTLLDTEDLEYAKRALPLSVRYLKGVESVAKDNNRGHMSEALWGVEVSRGRSRAMVLQARATGNMGNPEGALKLASEAWAANANSESAREVSKWLLKLKRDAEAIEHLANAFTVEDGRATEADRAHDRQQLGEVYRKLNGSEKGLGDAILAAYDRTAAAHRERLALLRKSDPNADATEVTDFTLEPADPGMPLALASLKGKTVIMDFWATWCGPCRVQHPMIEHVREKYSSQPGVVFLSVNSDDDRSLVQPFLQDLKWKGPNYFDSGLSRLLTVSSIPTVLILGPDGKVASRMAGFIPERFEDMLVERIEETRAN